MKVSVFMLSSVMGHNLWPIVKGPIQDYGNMSGNSKKPISKRILNYSVNQNNEIIHTRFVASHHCYRQLTASSTMEVHCWDQYCGANCPKGWKSENGWRIKCEYNAGEYDWTHKQFSPCITCPDMSQDLENLGIKNFEFTEFKTWWGRSYAFHCNEISETDYILSIKGEAIKKGILKKVKLKK